MEQLTQDLVHFVRDNQHWGPPLVGFLAFCESLAVISLFVPATSILLGIGILAAASNIDLVPVILGGGIGAALGDWVSYWFGWRYGSEVKNMGPFVKRQAILERGEAFFRRWGGGWRVHRPLLRAFAGDCTIAGRHEPHAVLGVPDRQLDICLDLVGLAAWRPVAGLLDLALEPSQHHLEGLMCAGKPQALVKAVGSQPLLVGG